MPTLGTQTIQSSYTQLLKTDGLGGIDATLQAVTDGDNTVSALELSSAGVRSTGTLNVAGATTLASSLAVTGAATFSSSMGVTGVGTIGTLQVGASGPKLTAVSFGTAAFTGSTFQDLDSATAGSNVTTGTFAVTGAALGDIVFGGLTSIGSSTGTNATLAQRLIPSFRVESADTIRYVILNTDIVSHGTTPAGTLYATAMRFTA